jgi:hypothetical protein
MTTSEQQTDGLMYMAPGTGWRFLAMGNQATDETDKEKQLQQVREANENLKNALLTSLQMQHLVVLAGSGCSQEAGGPSMGNLWNAAIGEEVTDTAKSIAERIRYDLDSPESKNIEAFLSQAEAFLQVHDDTDVKGFLNTCKRSILKGCSDFLNVEKLGPHQTFLHRLSRRRVRDQRLKVFTTNYDLCFERAASELGGVAIDGFSFTTPRRYDPRFFSYDIIRRPRGSDDFGNYLEGVFLLYKLHGSVNWARLKNGTILEKEDPEPEEACLIYPAARKYHQSFLQPHLESMSQYLGVLREPNTCVLVIGFSFNDDHLSEPLLAAVRSNPHLRLIVVNVHSEKQDRKDDNGNAYWQKLFELSQKGEDVWFVNAKFSEFAEMIPDLKALTPADNLMKAIQSVAKAG